MRWRPPPRRRHPPPFRRHSIGNSAKSMRRGSGRPSFLRSFGLVFRAYARVARKIAALTGQSATTPSDPLFEVLWSGSLRRIAGASPCVRRNRYRKRYLLVARRCIFELWPVVRERVRGRSRSRPHSSVKCDGREVEQAIGFAMSKLVQDEDAVAEVFSVVDAALFLRGDVSLKCASWVVVITFEYAAKWAWEMEWDQGASDGEYSWTDRRELMLSRCSRDRFDDAEKQASFEVVSARFDEVVARVVAKVPQVMVRAADDVAADLFNCMVVRSVVGRECHFWESVLQAYACGAWPCGWADGGEDLACGRLVVWFPGGGALAGSEG